MARSARRRKGSEACRKAAEFGGVAGVLIHAISERARQFYLRQGFIECPHHPMTLVARMKDLG